METSGNVPHRLDSDSDFLRQIVDTDPNLIFVKDEVGRFVFVNQAMANLYGVSPRDLVQRLNADVLPVPGDADAYSRADQQVLRDNCRATFEEVHHGGRSQADRWFLTSKAPIRLPDGRMGVLGVAQDISERKRIEDALRQSEAKFRDLAECTSDWLWEVDAKGRYTYSSPKVKDLLGYEPSEVIGKTPFDLMPPEEAARMRTEFRKLLADGRDLVAVENTNLHKNGRLVVLETSGVLVRGVDGELAGYRGIDRDVTERKRAEQSLRKAENELRESRRMLQLVLDTIPDRVFWKDRNSVFRGCNRRVVQDAGLNSPEEIIGKDDFQFSWREQAERYRADDRAVMESGQAKLNYEEQQTTADGRLLWLRTSKIPLRDPNGNVIGVLGTWEDITERKLAQEALARAKDAAEAASMAKDRFLATLSHELRTPLTPILLAAEALAGDAALPAHVREELQLIARNAELEARLIDDLLDLTRISRGKLKLAIETVDAHELIWQAVEACRRSDLGGKPLRISVELSAERHYISADPARFQQIVWNLMRNAMKFTPSGGSICVQSQNDSEGQLRVRVSDTGIGIDPERLPHIFDAFEQGGPGIAHQFGGLGLGLAICRALAEMHHGTIVGHSEGTGHGATFTLTLPTVAAPAVAMAPPSAPAAAARTLRILLVEDHESTARVLRQLLASLGHQVKVADSVASALAQASADAIELLISDLGLPDGSGHDLMRRLKAQFNLRGIALSGYGSEEDIRRSREAGFAEHLVKPITLTALEAAITSAVAM